MISTEISCGTNENQLKFLIERLRKLNQLSKTNPKDIPIKRKIALLVKRKNILQKQISCTRK